MNKAIFILLIGSFSILFSACSKTGNPGDKPNLTGKDFSLAVLNEGNYTWGNASLTLLNEDSGKVYQNYFQQQNAMPLGDVAQSILKWKESIYIVVNNSGKIEELDAENWKRTRTLSGLTSPRYILPINEQKAYVSDLYADAIHIVDMNSFTKTGQIAIQGWTENLVLDAEKAWVIEVDNKRLFAIDALTDKVLDSISLKASPNSLQKATGSNLFVLSSNKSASKSYLYKIDTELTEQVGNPQEWSGDCSKLIYAENYLYYIKNSSKLYRASLANLASEELLIDLAGKNIYGLEITQDYFYLTDAKDFARNGRLLKYTNSTTPVFIDSFETGRIPQAILAL